MMWVRDKDECDASDAAYYIGEGLLRWRVPVRQYKEKFGGVRVYTGFGLYDWWQLLTPGWGFYRGPRWCKFLAFPGGLSRAILRVLNLGVVPLHKVVYRRYYANAAAHWPHIAGKILNPADYPELLKGIPGLSMPR